MTAPALNDIFNPYYDLYSIPRHDLVIPDHFDVYVPDYLNEIDFQCLSVITPSIYKNAKQWTYNGKWLTIGIYRDEGRDTAIRPPTTALSWNRVGNLLTMIDPNGHKLATNNTINLFNTNTANLLKCPIKVLNKTTFTVIVLNEGPDHGINGAYQPTEPYNFFEQNYVFRLLPSFTLVPWSLIQKLFELTAPDAAPQQREMINITTGLITQLPRGISKTTNYNLSNSSQTISNKMLLNCRFNQVYDENGKALRVDYKQDGQPVSSKNFDAPHLSNNKRLNSSLMNEDVVFGDIFRIIDTFDNRIIDNRIDYRIVNLPYSYTDSNTRVYVFDFYGGEINDPHRGPYFSTELITRDPSKPAPYNNILRAGQNNTPYYGKKLFDIFNNLVIGIQENNATAIRQNLLPLALDRYNRPIKSPLSNLNKINEFL